VKPAKFASEDAFAPSTDASEQTKHGAEAADPREARDVGKVEFRTTGESAAVSNTVSEERGSH
jgi:hypothetical protein